MRRTELALTVVKHVKSEDGESESVAKLLDEEAGGHHPKVGRERVTQEDVNGVWQRYGANHRPKPLLHAVPADQHASQYASKQQTYQSDRALRQTVFFRRESQSAFGIGAH